MEYTETTERIAVSKDAYFYLWNKGNTERGGKALTKEREDIIWKRLLRSNAIDVEITKSGLRILTKNSIAGAENGRRYIYSVDDMRRMLKEAGYEWEELGTKTETYMTISIP
jgi:hypothetical protein